LGFGPQLSWLGFKTLEFNRVVSCEEFLELAEGVAVIERGISRQHLEDENTERPPVHWHTMPFVLQVGCIIVKGLGFRV